MVKASLSGVKPEEVDISITGDVLIIKGEHKEAQEVKAEDYLCKERRCGTFSRSATIPVQVNSDEAEAVFEDGILTLTLPRSGKVKPRSIKVKVKGVSEGKK